MRGQLGQQLTGRGHVLQADQLNAELLGQYGQQAVFGQAVDRQHRMLERLALLDQACGIRYGLLVKQA